LAAEGNYARYLLAKCSVRPSIALHTRDRGTAQRFKMSRICFAPHDRTSFLRPHFAILNLGIYPERVNPRVDSENWSNNRRYLGNSARIGFFIGADSGDLEWHWTA